MMLSMTLRRLVGTVLVATMLPSLSACHHQVRVSPARARSLVGSRVHLASPQPMRVSAATRDASRSDVTDVVEVQGVVLTVNSDSVRVRDATIVRVNGEKSGGYREVVLAASPDLIFSQRRIEPVGTTVLVVVGGAAVFAGALTVFMLARCSMNSSAGGC